MILQTGLPDFPEAEMPYYDNEKQELTGNQLSKARYLVEHERILPFQGDTFRILPVEGHTKQTHTVTLGSPATCTCQRNRPDKETGERKVCSHILAARLYLTRPKL